MNQLVQVQISDPINIAIVMETPKEMLNNKTTVCHEKTCSTNKALALSITRFNINRKTSGVILVTLNGQNYGNQILDE